MSDYRKEAGAIRAIADRLQASISETPEADYGPQTTTEVLALSLCRLAAGVLDECSDNGVVRATATMSNIASTILGSYTKCDRQDEG